MIKKTLAEFWDEYKPTDLTLLINSSCVDLESRNDIIFKKFENEIFSLKFVRYNEEYDGYEMALNYVWEN